MKSKPYNINFNNHPATWDGIFQTLTFNSFLYYLNQTWIHSCVILLTVVCEELRSSVSDKTSHYKEEINAQPVNKIYQKAKYPMLWGKNDRYWLSYESHTNISKLIQRLFLYLQRHKCCICSYGLSDMSKVWKKWNQIFSL